jgi:nucleoside-diphosphate-sugar epimerase
VQTSIASIVNLVRQIVSVDERPDWGTYPDRAWDTHTWVADSTRIQHDLGWLPRTGLDEGLRAFVAWLRAHPEYRRRYRDEQSVARA